MTPLTKEHMEAIVERWLRIQPQTGNRSYYVARSSIRLVKEYLRRVAEWASYLEEFRDLTTGDAIGNLAAFLPPVSNIQVYEEKLREIPIKGAWQMALAQIRWLAAWEELRMESAGLPDPFEPILRLFEHGGELFKHHGFIHVDHSGCFWPTLLASYAEITPLLNMSDEALDEIDKRYAKN